MSACPSAQPKEEFVNTFTNPISPLATILLVRRREDEDDAVPAAANRLNRSKISDATFLAGQATKAACPSNTCTYRQDP